MSQIAPIGDYNLDPPDDPPECPECDGPMHGGPLTCRDCGYQFEEPDWSLDADEDDWDKEDLRFCR